MKKNKNAGGMPLRRLPALQFYPGDWHRDAGVQSLNLEEKAVWLELIFLMHDSEKRGFLVLNGKPMSEGVIARLIRSDIPTVNRALSAIQNFGVASVEPETGIMYSRRMVREEEIRLINRMNGRKGGNPLLLKKSSDNRNSTGGDNLSPSQRDNPKTTPSSSSSTSGLSTTPPSPPPAVGDTTAARNGAEVEANGTEVEAKKEEKRTGPRRDRKGGGVGNGSKLDAARARNQGLQAKKTHPMLAKNPPKPPDPRRQPFKAEIFRWYADVNGREAKHTPWGTPGDRALDAMLGATSIHMEDLQTCLKHRAQSIGAGEYSSSLMPGAWLRKLPSFLSRPLDRYGNPLSSKRKPLG